MPDPTPFQKQAMEWGKGNCLVSAGAGSGKTEVLTRRIYQLVKNNICRLDQMLVLTFTNKAAFEMKARARALIAEDDKLRHLLPQVEQAAITTFDGFALSLVKSYHYELGIDEDVNIVDDAIMTVQRYRLIDQILESRYEKAAKGEDPEFDALVKAYCVKDDRHLINALLNVYSLASLQEDKREFLLHYVENHFCQSFYDSLIRDYVAYIRSLLDKYIEGAQQYKDTNLTSLDCNFLSNTFGQCKTYNELKAAFMATPKFVAKPSKKKDEKTAEDEEDDKLRKCLKAEYYDTAKYCCRFANEEEALNSYRCLKDHINVICELALELMDKESAFMKEHSCYRFEDIAYLARSLARREDIREKLRKTYTFIMVDEYQDTSDLQEDLLSLITTGNMYCVGDIKQSIYRFRNANPELFASKLDAYSKGKGGTLITLPDNFRSREQVLNDINNIFEGIMTKEVGGANYKAGHALNFGNHTFDATMKNAPYGVFAYYYDINLSMSREEQEAHIIAKDIIHKMNAKYLVSKKGVAKKVDFDSFAILTSSKTIYDTYARVFNEYGIPLAVSSEIELKEENIYFVMRNFFEFILGLMKNENSLRMKHLFASLSRSFAFGFNDEAIYNAIKGDTYLETNWVKTLKDSLYQFKNLSIEEIFSKLIEIFKIPAKLALTKDVLSNFERLETLFNASKTGASFGWNINDFVAYFNDLNDYDIKLGQELPPADSRAVKLMSIHASKGLQFPIIYLPQLYKTFKVSIPGNNPLIAYDLKYGIGLPNTAENAFGPTILSTLHAQMEDKENVSERMRLFYVALTRAEENAFLIVPKADLDDDGLPKEKPMATIANAKCFKDFVRFAEKDIHKVSLATEEKGPYKEDNPIAKRNVDFKSIKAISSPIPMPPRPSKEIKGKVDEGALVFGNKLHRLLQFSDFITKDVSWIKDPRERKLIENALNLPIFEDVDQAKIYREYEFLGEDGGKGIIDLLMVYPNKAVIVDYKTNNIDDEAYAKQLSTYANYVKKTFQKETHTYLLSILKAQVRQIS